jgi:hypothetical protein
MISTEMAHGLFRPLLDRLGQQREEHGFTPDEVRELLFACGTGAAVLDRLMGMLDNLLGQGLESRKACFLQKEFTDVVELALREVFPKARAITANSSIPEAERQSSLATLDDFIRRASTIRDELAKLQHWLERPAPRVDLPKIIGADTSRGYEDYVDTAELER